MNIRMRLLTGAGIGLSSLLLAAVPAVAVEAGWRNPTDLVAEHIYAPCKGQSLMPVSTDEVLLRSTTYVDAIGITHFLTEVKGSSATGAVMATPSGEQFVARPINGAVGATYDAWYDAEGNVHAVTTQKWGFKAVGGGTYGNLIRTFTELNGVVTSDTRSGSC